MIASRGAGHKRNAVEPFAWFRDVLSRIAQHPIHRIEELLPHHWKTLAAENQLPTTRVAPAKEHPERWAAHVRNKLAKKSAK